MSDSHGFTCILSFIILILTTALFAGIGPVEVHGTPVPMVCISITANSCPSSPPTFTAVKGSFLTIYVVAQEVGSFPEFTISVKTNASVLYPVNASTIGSVVAQGMPVGGWQCINGGLGPYCGAQDGPGVVSVTGWGYYATKAPTNGMIFSITYNATGSGSNVPIVFPSGCSVSSVSNGICVDLYGPTVAVQSASFTNILSSTGDFTMSSNTTSISLARGMMGAFRIILTGYSGFFGTMTLNAKSSSYAIAVWLSSAVVSLQINGTAGTDLDGLSLASIAPGAYDVTVTATSGSISHSLTLVMDIVSQEAVNAVQNGNFSNGLAYWSTGSTYGVSYGLPPRSYPIIQVTNATGSCTPSLLHGSSFLDIWNTLGSEGYAQESISVPHGGAELAFLSWGWITSGSESATVSIVSGGGESVLDTFVPVPSVNSTGACTGNLPEMKVYDISNYAGQTVSVRLAAEAYTCCRADGLFTDTLVVPKGGAGLRDFSISANPGSLTVPRTINSTFTVTLTSLNGFDTSVELNATVASSSPMWPYQIPVVAFSENTVAVKSGKSVNITGIFETSKTTPAASYTITIIGTSSRMQATTIVTANVPSVALLYLIRGPQTAQAGESVTFVNDITNVGDFTSRIIRVTVSTDFGTFTLLDDSQCPGNTPTMQIGNNLCEIPNAPLIAASGNITLRLSFTIPMSVSSGVHVLTETVQWQVRIPFPIIWEDANSIAAPFQTSISASPSRSPQPSPGPSSATTLTSLADIMRLVGAFGPIIAFGIIGILVATVLLVVRTRPPENRPASFLYHSGQVASAMVHCSQCNSPMAGTDLFCPNCGVRRTS